jgi:hypothetical protein
MAWNILTKGIRSGSRIRELPLARSRGVLNWARPSFVSIVLSGLIRRTDFFTKLRDTLFDYLPDRELWLTVTGYVKALRQVISAKKLRFDHWCGFHLFQGFRHYSIVLFG